VNDKKGHTRLYYVEDSAELRSRIDRELAQIEGVEVLGHAVGASEAVREIRKHQPDVVVLDLQLLEGSGLDVLRGLQHDDWRPIVMVLTNHSDRTSMQRSLRAGAQYFFDKSTEFDQFVATLNRIRIQQQPA